MSVCPHDCPGSCALLVDKLSEGKVGRIRGSTNHPYTNGIICAKVGRYAERVHSTKRITTPLERKGQKGSGQFSPISWDKALDTVVAAYRRAQADFGKETFWPYYYGGTMGIVQRGATNRLRYMLGGSGQKTTICSTIGEAGWLAGIGAKIGSDPREMIDSELIVFWGMNPTVTQINTWSHAVKARKTQGAKIVVIDPYRTQTASASDYHLALRPGTDGALACAVMHVLFRDGLADREYLSRWTDISDVVEQHLEQRTPTWASVITGLDISSIEKFAQLYGQTKRSFLRFGYGMTRSRNGAVALHAASCLPAITGSWLYRGGGALLSTSGNFNLDISCVEASDICCSQNRVLDMSQIGRILTGDPSALAGEIPVTAMFIQGSNPAVTAPESVRVRQGLAREDLFLCVHEQFLTDTALFADIVLPATTFLEHDDLYASYGHTFLQVAKAVIPPVGQARSNHDVVNAILQRLGTEHPSLKFDVWACINQILVASGLPSAETIYSLGWLDCAKSFSEQHFLSGFSHPDGKFRFFPSWSKSDSVSSNLPTLPDHAFLTEETDEIHSFRLITAPSSHFLNSTFVETQEPKRYNEHPVVLIHPDDCLSACVNDGEIVCIGNKRGKVVLEAKVFSGIPRGVIVVEGLWSSRNFIDGSGINVLTSAESVLPSGGVAFHDTAVWLRSLSKSTTVKYK